MVLADDFLYSTVKLVKSKFEMSFEYFRNAHQKRNSAAHTSSASSITGTGDQVQLLLADEGKVNLKTVNFLWSVTKTNFAYFMAGSVLLLIYDVLLFVAPQLLE